MDRTKIPKPSQCKVPKSGPFRGTTKNSQSLEDIVENKSAKPLQQQNPVKPPVRNVLRRRSKSVADLRTLTTYKPLQELKKNITKLATNVNPVKATNVIRQGQKRPMTVNKSEEIKPKVIKTKIPDWDYKTRFANLLEKHKALQETCKSNEQRLSDLAHVEDEVQAYKEQIKAYKNETEKLNQENISVGNNNATLTKENAFLRTENQSLIMKLDEITNEHKELLIRDQNNMCAIDALTNKNNNLEQQLKDLTKTHQLLEQNHELLTNSNGRLRLEYDTKVRDYEIIEDRLNTAENKVDTLTTHVNYLRNTLIENESLRRILHNTVQDLKGNIRVFCRVRPPVNNDELERMQCTINYIDETTIEIRKSKESICSVSGKVNDLRAEFSFDKVFPADSTQEIVFEELALLVQSALDGYNICVFAYGQTGSGKTYTMQGENSTKDLGMIPRSIDLTFEQIKKLERAGWEYTVKASFLEIYNENVRDLLNPNSNHNYDIYFNEGKGITVKNLKIELIKSVTELKHLMQLAHKNRSVAATDFNEHSSRSHAVTKLYLQGRHPDNTTVYTGSLNLVDLAGSESAKTSANERLVETKNINKSLSTLGSVMLALHNNDSHVPYRNSKLTYLLQSCLGGNSKTLMFVNIAPFEECYGESINSLRFASKVKEVKTGSKKNKTVSVRL